MMDLDTLFNRHSAQTDAALEGLPVPPFEDAQHRHRQRSIRIAVATFGTVALVAGVVLLFPRATDLPVAEANSTTTASVTTTTVVTDDPVALSGVELIASQWTSHKLGTDPLAVIGANSVSYVGSEGFFIAGTHWTRESTVYQARLWRSTDGTGWGVVPGSGTVFPERIGASGVIGDDSGMIAWGEGSVWGGPGGTVVWVSQDGTDWMVSAEIDTPLPTRGLLLESGEFMLYGGGNEDFDLGSSTGGETSLLLSADGITWDIIPAPVAFSAMVQLDSGEIVAIGGQAGEPMTWVSSDGQAWTLLSEDHSISQGQGVMVNALIVAGPGLIAGGTNMDGEAALWLSTDGRTFQQTASFPSKGSIDSFPGMGALPSVKAIAVGQDWLVAVGDYGWGGDQGRGTGGGAIWVSRDGLDWESVPTDLIDRRGTGLFDVAYGGSTFVAIGDRNQEPLVLRWQPESP
jgi:hypothetical protein